MLRLATARRTAGPLVAVALVVLASVLAACADDDDGAGAEPTGEVTVLAASSLTEAFEQIAEAFEADHPGVEVELTFDASSALATQIREGVPGDVFASADETSLAQVVDAGLGEGEPARFASNRLQIAVPRGNPAGVGSLADLASGDLRLALCAPEVPCGSYARQSFERAGLGVPAASEEENVRGVLTKVALGEADAGIVYVTDVLANGDVEGIDLPDAAQVVAAYPALALRDAPNPTAAAAFVAYLSSTEARGILVRLGFGPPTTP